MPATLLTGAAGQGKTQAAIQQVKMLVRRKLFSKVWILLPTELQISAFRTRLLDELGEAAHFGVEFFHFYDLYARLLEIVGTPQRRVKDTARFRILRHVLVEQRGALEYFRAIAETPGFVALLADFIQELKQARITPEDFQKVAATPKDRDLARLYTAYQTLLRQRNLVDGEGEGWLALARLEASLDLTFDVDLLIVDGYDQFNPVQAQLLAQLAGRVREMLLTLTYDPAREQTAHLRFAQTRATLIGYGVFSEKQLAEFPQTGRRSVLQHLSDNLFDIRPEQAANDGALTLIEAPDRRREVLTVLRRVKGLLRAGIAPEQIAILARNLEPYTPYFLETAPAFGIPLANRRGSPLAENPAIASLLSLIDLSAADFPRRALMDALRSVYLACPDLSVDQIAALDRVSRGRIVVRGHENWLEAIEHAARLTEDEDGNMPPDKLSEQAAAALLEGVARCFARITPPERATARQYVAWLESVIGPDPALSDEGDDDERDDSTGHFRMIERIRTGNDPAIVARDLLAMACLKQVFRDVLSAYELVDAYQRVPWETFRLDLRIAIDNATVKPGEAANRLGRVLLASVYEARGLSHDHVFLLGLSEGEFPARVGEDSLYTDEERRQMQAQKLPVLTRAEVADESSLFYEVTALAQQSLTLTRPYVDEKGDEWPASPYWRATQAVVDVSAERLPIAATATLKDAAQFSEVMVALAQALNDRPTPTQALLNIHYWLMGQPETAPRWKNVLHCRQVEHRRASESIPHDAYSGHLSDPYLLALIAEKLGPERLWSASQFNEYGTCPYKFFARRLLQLQALEEPEEGINAIQYGLLVHKVLEQTYRQIGQDGLLIEQANQERALEILEEVLDRDLAGAPERYLFRATPMWEQEQAVLRRKLRTLIAQDFSAESPISTLLSGERRAYRQEVRFGFDDQQPVIVDGGDVPLRVRGAIDRVDVIGDTLVVIDYKTGSSPIPASAMVEGHNVQMMLYILAARQVMGDRQIGGGAFWHVTSNKLSGDIPADDAQIEEARANLHERIRQGRQGLFVNVPGKKGSQHCASYCEYSQLCRADRTSHRKPITS
jgi:ATP-dependent helicase/nuclease subunit B